MTAAVFVLIQYRRVTDKHTDGRTAGQTRRYRKDRAQHSVARVKIEGISSSRIISVLCCIRFHGVLACQCVCGLRAHRIAVVIAATGHV